MELTAADILGAFVALLALAVFFFQMRSGIERILESLGRIEVTLGSAAKAASRRHGELLDRFEKSDRSHTEDHRAIEKDVAHIKAKLNGGK